MRRAITLKRAGSWTGESSATVTLPFEDRHRRRIRMTDDAGGYFLLDLPDAVRLADGDALILDQGGMIVVRAALERVADLHCKDTADALRLAWHIGNRHTPVQVLPDGVLRIADDHVLVAMAQGLGASITQHMAPFQPEGGAYATGHGHAH
jgi:urease accessory protein